MIKRGCLLLILTTQQMIYDIHSFKGMDSSDLSEIAKTVAKNWINIK